MSIGGYTSIAAAWLMLALAGCGGDHYEGGGRRNELPTASSVESPNIGPGEAESTNGGSSTSGGNTGADNTSAGNTTAGSAGVGLTLAGSAGASD